MKQGGMSLLPRGFTMVEVLIVLAVTSSLLIVAMVVINGRQLKTEFAVGSRQIRQDLEQIINETASGYYPNNNNFTCGGNVYKAMQSIGNGPTEQGANAGCIFAGKAIISGGTAHQDNMRVIPLSGNRLYDDNGKKRDVKTVAETHPTAIAPGGPGNNQNAPDQSSEVRLPIGFRYAGYWIGNGIFSSQQAAFAVLSDLSAAPAQHFTLYAIPNWTPRANAVEEVGALNGLNGAAYNSADVLHLCFLHDGVDKSVGVTLGRTGGTAVEMDIYEGARCGK